jgi:anti-sigma regulatory factor (Ser/Thr protein kinase)
MKEIVRDKKIFEAALINLYQMLIWIRERIAKYFSQKNMEKIELAAEEVIVNIVKHAYKKKKGKIEIEILLNEYLELIFKDKGPKFNPLNQKKRNYKIPTQKRKIGGMGIFLIFECVDEVKYLRKNSFNILVLKKKRSSNY